MLTKPFKKPFAWWNRLQTRALSKRAKNWRLPQHVGLILDGNRRFARGQGLASSLEGHRKGADKLIEVLEWCQEIGVTTLSVWVFSLENFERPADEVQGLMALFAQKFNALARDERVHKNHIQVRALGHLHTLPQQVQRAISNAQQSTQHYSQFLLQLYIAYSGQEELVDATKAYIQKQSSRGLPLSQMLSQLTPQALESNLYAPTTPGVDLIIRTSGELRLSGFMLWQSAYAELYFCSTHWPAFQKQHLLKALQNYHQRQRRFGR